MSWVPVAMSSHNGGVDDYDGYKEGDRSGERIGNGGRGVERGGGGEEDM